MGHSDHKILMVTARIGLEKNQGSAAYRDFYAADFAEIRKMLNINWEEELRGMGV